jgi:hypothetical protein
MISISSSIKVLALAVLVPAISGRVLTGWPSALDEDFQDRVDMPEVQSEAREGAREEPVEVLMKQLEGRDFNPPKEAFGKQHDFEANDAGSDGQGYFQGFGPREIVLDDNQSIESRFAFPDFPK